MNVRKKLRSWSLVWAILVLTSGIALCLVQPAAGQELTWPAQLTYTEIEGSKPSAHGLLMNARFIQGIFDDRAAPERFARWGHEAWDATAQTQRLVEALPQWHAQRGGYLRAEERRLECLDFS